MPIYLSVDRIRRGDHTASRVQSGMDACLCDGYRLLFHDFVYSHPVDIGHFVELVDADYTPICKNHSPGFQSPFSGFAVGRHGSGETDAGASPSGSGDCERCNVQHETEHLRFGGRRVTDHEHIDITTNMSTVWKILFCTAEKEEEHRLLDVVVTTNRRSERHGKQVDDVVSFGEPVDVTDVAV